jgi:selenide,water dikinase
MHDQSYPHAANPAKDTNPFDAPENAAAFGANRQTERATEFDDLTIFAAGGGCSCKLPAETLALLFRDPAIAAAFPQDHVVDDAAILPLGAGQVLVSSVDFQNPIVPDSYHSGEIAALNALSDLCACGVQPKWAEVLLALPRISPHQQVEVGKEIMRGVAAACREVNCSIVGGHTVVADTPLIGLSVKGVSPLSRVKLKSGAKPTDVLVLTKPLGIGIAVASHQSGFLVEPYWDVALAAMRTSNRVGVSLAEHDAVHAITDITGFGLLGHACEMAMASDTTIEIDYGGIPVLPGVHRAAVAGFVPALAETNLSFAHANGADVSALSQAETAIVSDPQTNGGLLIAVAADQQHLVLQACNAIGQQAWRIGVVKERAADAVRCRITKGHGNV